MLYLRAKLKENFEINQGRVMTTFSNQLQFFLNYFQFIFCKHMPEFLLKQEDDPSYLIGSLIFLFLFEFEPVSRHWRENQFPSFQQLSWGQLPGQAWDILPTFHAEILSGLNLCRSYACCHSPCELRYISAVVSVSLESSTTSGSYSLSSFSSTKIPNPSWEECNEDIPSVVSAPSSSTLHTIQLWFLVLIPIYHKQKHR